MTACVFAAVSIRVVGGDFVMVTESNLTLTFDLAVTGFSFGAIPLRVAAVSYDGFDEMQNSFGVNATLQEIAGSNLLPSMSADACENNE